MATIKCKVPPLASPEIEAAVERARGAKIYDPWSSRVRRNFGELVRTFTRKRPMLDNVGDALTKDLLRQKDSAPEFGKTIAANEMKEITKTLQQSVGFWRSVLESITPGGRKRSSDRYEAFARIIWMRDVVRDYHRDGGRQDLPFNYEDIAQVEGDLAALEAIASQDEALQVALQKRYAKTTALTKRLVQANLMRKEALEDPRYYHRQVISMVMSDKHQMPFSVGTRDLTDRKKGFQKGRYAKTQMDFNTAYHEAEFEWMAQAYAALIEKEIRDRLESHLNIARDLHTQAKVSNEEAVRQLHKDLGIEGGLSDPYKPFSQKIAIANSQLARMAANGSLDTISGKWDGLVEALREEYQYWKANKSDLDLGPFQFQDSRWFAFLNDLAKHGDEQGGKIPALTVFKTIADRKQFTRDFLESNGQQHLTWEDLIPEGFTTWSPKPGARTIAVSTITERQIEQVLAGGDVSSMEFKQMQAMLPSVKWVIPSNVAEAFDTVANPMPSNPIAKAFRRVQQMWKKWTLINLYRVVKYNWNNFTGDLDIVLAYSAADARGIFGSAKALKKAMNGKGPADMQTHYKNALKYGAVSSGQAFQEIDDIGRNQFVRALYGEDLNLIQKYWQASQDFTNYRENILRYHMYIRFLKKLEAGKRPYGASRAKEMDALYDEYRANKISKEELAGKLSRELVGDYGNVSRGGEWLRQYTHPFYSWIEVNAPRYAHLLRNAAQDETASSRAKAIIAKRTVGWTAVKTGKAVGAFYALQGLVMAYNYARWDEDEVDDFMEQRKQLHLILYKDENGDFVSLRTQGAWSDAMGWFGLEDWYSDIQDVKTGRASLADKAADAAKGPTERFLMATGPHIKGSIEMLTGQKFFPTVFEEGASLERAGRPIRSGTTEIARTWSVDYPYLKLWEAVHEITGAVPPAPPTRTAGDFLTNLYAYRTPMGEASYWSARRSVWRFQSDVLGEDGPGGFEPSEKSNALFFFRQAARWGQEEVATKWVQEYIRLGGTPAGLKGSIKRQHPLNGLNAAERTAYLKQLNDADGKNLESAIRWYESIYE